MSCRGFLPWVLPALLLAAPAAADIPQDRFVSMIQQVREKLGEATDSTTIDALTAERRSAQCSLSLAEGLEVTGWTGVVQGIAPVEGGVALRIAFADKALVVTNADKKADGEQNVATLVMTDQPATEEAKGLQPDDRVVFSGHFLPVDDGCLVEVSAAVAEDPVRTPAYLFVFTEVKKL